MKRFLIIDCYVDEPACLGVPPFISPYPRMIAGALLDAGADEASVKYMTIDDVRRNDFSIPAGFDEIFIIGGAVVPGRYLGAKIGTFAEIKKIIELNDCRFTVGGLISRLPMFDEIGGDFVCIKNDIEYAAYTCVSGEMADQIRPPDACARWASRGAFIVKQHHDYPHLIAEMETYRGCPREKKCSFCSENIFTATEFRSPEDILGETDALIALGITRFRLGRQADILCYGADMNTYRNGFPKPNPETVKTLFSAMAQKRERGEIQLLCIDNANPGTIAAWPEECAEILEAIANAVTEGDTMALGAESFDPALFECNYLKASKDDVLFAVKLINEKGGWRRNGIPVILPGINLIHGLTNETSETFRINYETLKEISDSGMMLKRINIRKIQPFPGTPLYERGVKSSRLTENRYDYYKKRIREEIDPLMLERIYPGGTVIKSLRVEEIQSGYSYARQIASYPIICKIPIVLPQKSFVDCVVVSHRERSLMALPLPVMINELPQKALEAISGVGKSASKIILNRPLKREDIRKIVPSISPEIEKHFEY